MRLSFIIYFFIVIAITGCNKSDSAEGTFKSWVLSETGAIGLIQTENPLGNRYCKISKTSKAVTKVEEYSENGRLVETVNLNFSNGKITSISHMNEWGYIYRNRVFKNIGEGKYFTTSTTDGKNTYLPCKGIIYQFEDGLLSSEHYTGFDDKPCRCENNYFTAKYKNYTDNDGRLGLVEEKSYFDDKDNPIISNEDDSHIVKYKRDDNGNIIEEAYFGLTEDAIKNRFGVHKIVRTFDNKNNNTEVRFIGVGGETVSNIYGIAMEKCNYEDGKLSKTTRYNTKNEIVTEISKSSDGASIIKYEYDKNGNNKKESYYDKEEHPLLSNNGYHLAEYSYDDKNRLVGKSYIGLNGNRVVDNTNIHRYYFTNDDFGRKTGEAYFDANNNPTMDYSSRVYMQKYKYDSNGRLISTSFWKDDNTKMARWSGEHEQKYIFNEQGLLVEIILLNETGDLMKSTAGESRTVIKYDNLSRIISRENYDGNKPILMNKTAQVSNHHKITYQYDNQGKVSNIEYFDTNGNPTNALINAQFGVHKIQFEYEGNKIVRQNWYVKDNNIPVKVLDCNTSECMHTGGGGLFKQTE